MRFLEQLPQLPSNEGRLWSHDTGGEHATKFLGSEWALNHIRQGLSTITGEPVRPISFDEFADILQGGDQEVILVDRYDLPEGDGIIGLVAGAIVERRRTGRFDKLLKVKEIVVHPELRQRKIASFILGRIPQLEVYGSSQPTEMSVDISTYKIENWFLEKLRKAGFRHTDSEGSPAIWLPGNIAHSQKDLESPEVVRQLLEAMPAEWSGYLDLYPETDPQTQVFQTGQLSGIIKPIDDTAYFEDGIGRLEDFNLLDAGGVAIGRLESVTQREAMLALINNY